MTTIEYPACRYESMFAAGALVALEAMGSADVRAKVKDGLDFLTSLADADDGRLELTEEVLRQGRRLGRAIAALEDEDEQVDSESLSTLATLVGVAPGRAAASPGSHYALAPGEAPPISRMFEGLASKGLAPSDLPDLLTFDHMPLGGMKEKGQHMAALGVDLLPGDADQWEVGGVHGYRCDEGLTKGAVMLWGPKAPQPAGCWIFLAESGYETTLGEPPSAALAENITQAQGDIREKLFAWNLGVADREFHEAA